MNMRNAFASLTSFIGLLWALGRAGSAPCCKALAWFFPVSFGRMQQIHWQYISNKNNTL